MLDLRAQYEAIREEVRAALDEVLRSQHFILGPQGRALEEEVAGRCGAAFGIGTASGTDALVLALRACGVGPGDEVILPAFTFIATASAVSILGAQPVFADILPDTFNLDPASVAARLTPRTKAILPVHLYGLPAEMDALTALARARGLRVVEDDAQAVGASYKGRPTGSLGDAGCLSFYPSKNLGAYGDAGMVVTNSEELAARVRALRDHGQTQKYVSAEPGWNSRLDELQAAVLRVKLRHLDGWQAARQAHAAEYAKRLGGVAGVVPPAVPEGCEHVFHQYTVRILEQRDRVQQALAARGIASTVYYPVPLHLQPAFAALGCRPGELPESERAAREVLSLPIYPELTPAQIHRVAASVAEAARP
jgi:dTDP-4-amino-4,6-dideoxygalactose transaminase